MSARADRRRQERVDIGRMEEESEGVSHDIELHRMPSSTSVFRTPSSAASLSEIAEE